jgi:hypothetical protein
MARAPEAGDVRRWAAMCPCCGRAHSYYGQYEGERVPCKACERKTQPAEETIPAEPTGE